MQIKVYTADVGELENEELFRYVYSRVTPVRKEKTDRMRFDSDKRLTLGAGALLEAVISSLGVKDLLFVEEQNGSFRTVMISDSIFLIREQKSCVRSRIMISAAIRNISRI